MLFIESFQHKINKVSQADLSISKQLTTIQYQGFLNYKFELPEKHELDKFCYFFPLKFFHYWITNTDLVDSDSSELMKALFEMKRK